MLQQHQITIRQSHINKCKKHTSDVWIRATFSPDDDRRKASGVDDAPIKECRMGCNDKNGSLFPGSLPTLDYNMHPTCGVGALADETQQRRQFPNGANNNNAVTSEDLNYHY